VSQERAIDGARGDTNDEIRMLSRFYDLGQHPNLEGTKATAAGKHECGPVFTGLHAHLIQGKWIN
jgi:hypothetical protein